MNIEVFIKRKSCLVIESPLRLRFTKLNHDFTGLGVKQGLSRSTGRFYLIYVASKTKTLCELLKKSFKFAFLGIFLHPRPRDQFFQSSRYMENSFKGCLGRV